MMAAVHQRTIKNINKIKTRKFWCLIQTILLTLSPNWRKISTN